MTPTTFYFTLLAFSSPVEGFQIAPQRCRSLSTLWKGRDDYQFGDITRGFLRQATDSINEITGKEKYEFGDLSRYLDERAKDKVNQVTGKEKYQFGDISRFVDSRIKGRINEYTGEDEFTFGDLSKEVSRRVWAGEYALEDVLLAFRILLAAGVALTPLASQLPVQILMNLINMGLAQQIGEKVLEGLATAVDERMKEAVTGDKDYRLGDMTKKRLSEAVSSFTGKERYEFGDLSRRIAELSNDPNTNAVVPKLLVNDASAEKELSDWDERLLKGTQRKPRENLT